MVAEVIGEVGECKALKLLKDKVNFAFEEQRFEVGCPALGGRQVVWETGLSGQCQMLDGMKPIHHLHGTREQVGTQAPNPGGTVSRDNHQPSVGAGIENR